MCGVTHGNIEEKQKCQKAPKGERMGGVHARETDGKTCNNERRRATVATEAREDASNTIRREIESWDIEMAYEITGDYTNTNTQLQRRRNDQRTKMVLMRHRQGIHTYKIRKLSPSEMKESDAA